MLRKIPLIFVLALLAALTLTPLTAQESQPDVFALAALAPATDDVYVSIRIDDAYIATLNNLAALVGSALKDIGAPIEALPRLQDLIALQIDPNATPEQADAVLALMGDTLAISGNITSAEAETYTVYLPISDQQAVLDAINATGAGLRGVGTAGRFMIYEAGDNSDTQLLLADDLLMVTTGDANLLGGGDYAKLSDLPNFASAVADLPADGYNLTAYVNAAALAKNADMDATFNGDILIAGTILGDKTLTLDAIAIPATPAAPSQPIDPAFLRYVPASSTAVIHATDLSNVINNIITLAEAQGNASARAEIDQALSSLDLKLDNFLAWTKGDYALFARTDMSVLMQAAANQNFEAIATAVDFGVVIQASDTALAKQFSDKIAGLLAGVLASQPGVVISTKDINGTTVTRIEISAPMGNGQTLNVALGMGANANVFVFGTFRAVESILTDTSGLSANPLYAEGMAYLLPNATSAWYTDGATLSTAGVALLGTMGMAVGSASSSIQQEFSFGRQTAARAQTIQSEDDLVMLMRAIERFTTLVRFTTASTAVSDSGSYVLRATLTLGE